MNNGLTPDSLGTAPGGSIGGFNQIGNWVPGAPPLPYPEGTGIRVEPGSMIVAQVHYNTLSADPIPDQTTIELATTPEVDKEAILMQMTDLAWVSQGMLGEAMTIPAGENNVEHSTTAGNDSLFVRAARRTLVWQKMPFDALYGSRSHAQSGRVLSIRINHPDGSNTCLLEIQDWDFLGKAPIISLNPFL